ncbi:MAG: DNA-binding response regulator, partial [Planctomycetota bacterium]
MSLRDDGPVRVVLVDRSAIFRNAVSAGIHRNSAVRVVAGASSAAELRSALLEHHPEVIVVDLGLERNDAIRLIQQLRQLY